MPAPGWQGCASTGRLANERGERTREFQVPGFSMADLFKVTSESFSRLTGCGIPRGWGSAVGDSWWHYHYDGGKILGLQLPPGREERGRPTTPWHSAPSAYASASEKLLPPCFTNPLPSFTCRGGSRLMMQRGGGEGASAEVSEHLLAGRNGRALLEFVGQAAKGAEGARPAQAPTSSTPA